MKFKNLFNTLFFLFFFNIFNALNSSSDIINLKKYLWKFYTRPNIKATDYEEGSQIDKALKKDGFNLDWLQKVKIDVNKCLDLLAKVAMEKSNRAIIIDFFGYLFDKLAGKNIALKDENKIIDEIMLLFFEIVKEPKNRDLIISPLLYYMYLIVNIVQNKSLEEKNSL